jgi:hypothetical protein
MPRRTKEWYIQNNKPVPESFEKKNYNWYVQRGLTPPAHLKVPKVIKDTVGNLVQVPFQQHNVVGPVPVIQQSETEEKIELRIKTRFDVFETLVDDVIEGDIRGLIVSGPPGMGKSFPVEEKLKEVEMSRIVKGHASARGLYELLYQYSEPGAIVVMDDADSIFGDEKGLNLLKSALDTTEERVLSWVTSEEKIGEDSVPTSFVFQGSIIFITNLDFDAMIAKGNRIAKHLEAIMSRTHYVDLMMKSARDFFVRIKQVVRETKMLHYLNATERKEVIKFLEDNMPKLRELSLRTALKVGTLRKSNENWQDIAKITCCKN